MMFMPSPRDLKNQRFGKLIAIRPTPERKSGSVVWLCVCDCGNEKLATAQNLSRGDAKSCGCSTNELISAAGYKYGRPPGYNSWAMMKQRCENPRASGFKNYGGRGISICARWRSFENFIIDMGPRPSPDHSIERTDGNANYGPSNCYWASTKEQGQNKRTVTRVSAFGKTQSIQAWASEFGISQKALAHRILIGIPPEIAITLPPQRGRAIDGVLL